MKSLFIATVGLFGLVATSASAAPLFNGSIVNAGKAAVACDLSVAGKEARVKTSRSVASQIGGNIRVKRARCVDGDPAGKGDAVGPTHGIARNMGARHRAAFNAHTSEALEVGMCTHGADFAIGLDPGENRR